MNTKISEALSDALLETRGDNGANLGENLTLKILEKANIPMTQGDLSKSEWDDLTKTVADFAKPAENKIETDKPQGYNEVTDAAAGIAKRFNPDDIAKTLRIKYTAADRARIREERISEVTNQKLKNCMGQLYRPTATVGDGGTADAMRQEINTGKPIKDKFHAQKAEERIRNIQNIIRDEDLSQYDIDKATYRSDELKYLLNEQRNKLLK